jgi:hypothetical protein
VITTANRHAVSIDPQLQRQILDITDRFERRERLTKRLLLEAQVLRTTDSIIFGPAQISSQTQVDLVADLLCILNT